MTTIDKRKYWETLYAVFRKFGLEDQRLYYQQTIKRYRKAGGQVNFWRAFFALVTGLASAAGGFLVAGYLTVGSFANGGECVAQTTAIVAASGDVSLTESALPDYCHVLRVVVVVLAVLAVVAPAIGAAFTTLSDLYQWDRLVATYESALENMEVADAQSPVAGMTELEFRGALRAYAETALSVMRDETAQWGQIAKPPQQIEKFIQEEIERARRVGGVADNFPAANARAQAATPPPEPPLLPEVD